jgi:hypothetical protein
MSDTATRPTSPIAVVGLGAIMPDAPDADAFWANITGGRYSISDVPPERWDPALYYSPDHDEPDKTYSKVGGWVRDFPWDPDPLEAADPAEGRRSDGRRSSGGRSPPRGLRSSMPGGPTGRPTPTTSR